MERLISSISLFVLLVMRIKSLEGTPTSIISTVLRLRRRSISSHREEFTDFISDSLHHNVKAKRRQWSLPNDGNGVRLSFRGDFQAVGGSNNIVNARDGTAMEGIVHNNHLGLVGYYLGSGVYTSRGVGLPHVFPCAIGRNSSPKGQNEWILLWAISHVVRHVATTVSSPCSGGILCSLECHSW